ncbi:MAG: chemotaxis protein CheA, partial [Planctomycetota bacterium]
SWLTTTDEMVNAVLAVLREQQKGIADGKLLTPESDRLLEMLKLAVDGDELPAEAVLPDSSGADEAIVTDQVVPLAPVIDSVDDAAEAGGSEPAAADQPGAANPAADDAPAKPATGNARQQTPPEQTLRVEVSRLESLMNLVGELVLQKNRVCDLADRATGSKALDHDLSEGFEVVSNTLSRITSEIQVAVMRTRMQPLDKLFGKYPRLIRDLATKTGKEIRLIIEGGETEVDKSVIENLGDPLVHIMRNSSDHGLEGPEEREAAGKDRCGTITLAASQRGNHVEIQIKDDGRGLNRERISEKAVERGLTTVEEIEAMSDNEVGRFIFLPGFSTAAEVSDLSGRGVGMDVVLTNIRKLEGEIDVHTETGVGTIITITIPLTVAIMPAMMVRVHEEQYAVPLASIIEIVRPDDAQLSTILESQVIRLRDRVLPVIDAAKALAVPEGDRIESAKTGGDDAPKLCLVLESSGRRVGVLVTSVVGQQEIVIKPLESGEKSAAVSGATVRNDGGVSLIVDVASIVRNSV